MKTLQENRAELIREVLWSAGRRKINYALMRNFRQVLSGTAKDADILVSGGDLERFSSLVVEAARLDTGWRFVQVVRSRYGRRVVALHWHGYSAIFDLRSVVRLDSGMVPARIFLVGRRWTRQGFSLLGREEFLTCLFIHHRRKPKPDYLRILESAFREDRALEIRIENRLKELAARYRERPLHRFFRRVGDIRFWMDFLFPAGLYVVVNGPDGVGKTTALAELGDRLEGLGICFRIRHLGGKTGMLPERPFRQGVLPACPPGSTSPPAPPRVWPAVLDIPRLLYHFLDIQLYQWLVIRKFQASGGWFIADKFFTYAVKSRSMGFAVPEGLIRVLYLLLPRPDLFILLWNEPEEIARRKGELTPREAAAHALVLDGMSRRSRYRLVIKTDRPPAVIAEEMLAGIVSRGEEQSR